MSLLNYMGMEQKVKDMVNVLQENLLQVKHKTVF